MLGTFSLILMTSTMIVLGLVVWRLVNRQERSDDQYESKLKADDERAEKGRVEDAARWAAWEEHKRRAVERPDGSEQSGGEEQRGAGTGAGSGTGTGTGTGDS